MEFRDLYDIDRRPLGKSVPRGSEVGSGEYFTVVHACIFNSNGQMLIQQRAHEKAAWPDAWDVSVGGSVIKGETSRDAIAREMREELGLELDFSQRRPGMTMNFEHGFDDFYLIEADVGLNELSLQHEEVQSVRWADRGEIHAMLASGSFIPFFGSMIDLLFDTYKMPDCLNI